MAENDLVLPLGGDGVINLRVGAIIMKDSKLLMTGNNRDNYLYSVGGRLQFGESAEQAVIREVFEETGYKLSFQRLAFTHENFFLGTIGGNKTKRIYELSFYFIMNVPEDFDPVCQSETNEGLKEHLVWITADTKLLYYPIFFRDFLLNPSQIKTHYVTREW